MSSYEGIGKLAMGSVQYRKNNMLKFWEENEAYTVF